MDILHFSDFHFGNKDAPFKLETLAEKLGNYASEECINPLVILSGDITFKGRKAGYEQASEFVNIFLEFSGVTRSRVIACPGNHDIVNKSFKEFDKFIYGIRRDSASSFSNNSSRIIEFEDAVIYLLNSSYHRNYTYGLIDEDCFSDSFNKYKGKLKIAVTHHHMLNMIEADSSALRNSYGFIKHLEESKFSYIFHGHQHAEQSFSIGENKMKVYSARSGNFCQSGLMNGINVYKVNDDVCETKFVSYENSGKSIKIRRVT